MEQGETEQTVREQEGAAPIIPADRPDLRVISGIRRIMRAVDLFSRRLAGEQGVTAPQLLCLNRVVERGGLSIKELAAEVYLSPSTVVGIVNRLESRLLVKRERLGPDKRVVRVVATEVGEEMLDNSPSALHEELLQGFGALAKEEQLELAEAVEKLVSLMEIEQVEAAPILENKADLLRPEL
ncbi:MAG: MarR family winged helix-turn-helix transcriptional regulator [Verrucomicrobiota bacterium JB023]|nr:MarR family winged helix-turn-helix transcriptional regulator [Verrucomicrobiota bacterium JB023]